MPFLHSLKQATPMPIRNALRPLTSRAERILQHRRLRALYQTIVRPGDLVFDIGAHLGEHTEHFLALGAQVVALEPAPSCRAALRRLQYRNPLLSVLFQAVGQEEGAAHLCIPDIPAHATLSPDHQARRFPGEDYSRRVSVQVTTLDSLIYVYGLPDYIKIDTEGHELPALMGLHHRPRFLSFEFSRENIDDLRACALLLPRARFNVSLYSNQQFALPEWVSWSALSAFLDDQPDPRLRGDIFARLA